MIKNNVQCFVATQVTACIQIRNKEERQERREKAGGRGGGSPNSEWGWRGGGQGTGRVRITNLNTASHLCVASSEMEGKGVRGVKGKAVYFGGGGGSSVG